MEGSTGSAIRGVTGSSVRRAQKSVAILPGNRQKKKAVVQCKVAATRVTGQMATASNRFWQTTGKGAAVTVVTGGSGITRQPAGAGKSSAPETGACAYQVTNELQTAVEASLETLKREQEKHGAESLSYCLAVIKELDRLLHKFKIGKSPDNGDYQFVASRLGPHYVCSLKPALDELKSETDTRCGWKHHRNLASVIKHLDLQTGKLSELVNNEASAFCQQLLWAELSYLHYVKALPVMSVGRESLIMMDELLSSVSELPDGGRDLIGKEDMDAIKKEKEYLTKIIEKRINNCGAEEYIKEFAEEMSSGTPDIRTKRRYAELLKIRLSELKGEGDKKGNGIQERFLALRKLYELHEISLACINEFYFVCYWIKASISGIARIILKDSMNNVIRLEDEVLDFIDNLKINALLSETGVRFYLRCREFQAAMGTVVQKDKITQAQLTMRLGKIQSCLDKQTHADYLAAADMLMRLLYWCGDEMKEMKMKELYASRIKQMKASLLKELFMGVLTEFKVYDIVAKSDLEEHHRKMSKYRAICVTLSPYLFVVDNAKDKGIWVSMACAAWYCDLERLTHKESFNEEDVDLLLELKRVTPDVPDGRVMTILGCVLEHLLSSILEGGPGGIPLGKIETIRQWVNNLCYIKSINKRQKEFDETRLEELNDAVFKQLFNIGPVAPESVAMKRKRTTTVNTTSDQPRCSLAKKMCSETESSHK